MLLRLLTARMVGFLAFTFFLNALCTGQDRPVIPRAPHSGRSGEMGAPSINVSPGNWSQLSKFISGRRETYRFANWVAIAGDTVVVSTQPVGNAAAAYIFLKTAAGWGNTLPVAALGLPSFGNGISQPVAIDRDVIVIGDPSTGFGFPSYAYVYVKPAGGWTDMKPTAILTPSDSMDGYFGLSVSISGDNVVVGDLGGFNNSTTGSAYLFTKPASGWVNTTETAKLTASDVLPSDYFGLSVSIGGNTVAVGAPQTLTGPGKAYVFVKSAAGWSNMTQTAELTASDAQLNFDVGNSVSVGGDNVLVGAPSESNLNYPSGNAYVFTKPLAGWANMTQTAELLPGDGRPGERFGASVAISGKMASVGAPGHGTPPNNEGGAVYIFEEPAGGWQNMSGVTVLTGSDARTAAYLGGSVGMSGNVLAGGANFGSGQGAAYVFGLP